MLQEQLRALKVELNSANADLRAERFQTARLEGTIKKQQRTLDGMQANADGVHPVLAAAQQAAALAAVAEEAYEPPEPPVAAAAGYAGLGRADGGEPEDETELGELGEELRRERGAAEALLHWFASLPVPERPQEIELVAMQAWNTCNSNYYHNKRQLQGRDEVDIDDTPNDKDLKAGEGSVGGIDKKQNTMGSETTDPIPRCGLKRHRTAGA